MSRELEYQLDEFNNQINEMTKLSSKWADDVNAMKAKAEAKADEDKKQNEQSKKYFEHLRNGIKEFANPGVTGFLHTMQSGQSGMAKYSQSLSSMIGSVGTASKMLGFLSGPIGLAVTAISSLVGAVLEQNDKILESFDDLAEIGVTAGMTAEQLDQIVDKSQGNLKYIKSFTDSIKKLGGNLLTLGKTTAEGTMKFAEITRLGSDVRDQFRNLGLSQEQVNEMQADYIKQYALLDNLKDKDARQIRAASLNWIKQTMALTAVTGMTKEQQEEANKALESDVATQARLFSRPEQEREGMRAIAQVFEQIKAGYGKELISKMTIGYSADAEFNTMIATYFDKDALSRIKKAAAKGTEAAVDATMAELRKVDQRLMQNTETNAINVANLATHGVSEVTGMTSSLMELLAKSRKAGSLSDVMGKLEQTSKEGDNLLKARNETVNLENKFTGALQKFIRLVSGPVTQAFQWIARTVNEMLEAMMENTVIAKLLGLETDNDLGARFTRFGDVKTGQVKLAKLIEMQTQYEADLRKLGNEFDFDTRTGEYEFNEERANEIAAKRKEIDQLKKNRILAESNLRTLAEQSGEPIQPPPKPVVQDQNQPGKQQTVNVQIQSPPTNPAKPTQQPVKQEDQKKQPLPQIDGDKLQRTALSLPSLKENEPSSPFYSKKKEEPPKKPESVVKKPSEQQPEQLVTPSKKSEPVIIKVDNPMMAKTKHEVTKPDTTKKPEPVVVKDQTEKPPIPKITKVEEYRPPKPIQQPVSPPVKKEQVSDKPESTKSEKPTTPENPVVKQDNAITDKPSAAKGAIMEGPKSGYKVEMHGLEAVVPLSGNRSIPVEFTKPLMAQISGLIESQQSKIKQIQETIQSLTEKVNASKPQPQKIESPKVTQTQSTDDSILKILTQFFDELNGKLLDHHNMTKEIFAAAKR